MLALMLVAPFAAQAGADRIAFSPGAVDSALAKGCAVFLEFGASW
jgi:hypothetical protein